MYDDHRRKGEPLATEAEFRGYYALLKLDQHPGFAVEPSDLSVNLASMSPSMRNSAELIFPRKVARMYKMPNYIGFFKLAAKATYLQACLMHAQFSKVRTQALASLYSGLRVSQGIPLSQLKAWLGMEKHEIGDLLSYHGFSIKLFEEPFVVKESELLNKDQGYGPHRSKLVESKRASKMINDVLFQNREAAQLSMESPELRTDLTEYIPMQVAVEAVEEEMPDYDDGLTPTFNNVFSTVVDTPASPSSSSQLSFFNWLQPASLSQPTEKHQDLSVTGPSVAVVAQERIFTGKRTRSDDYEEQDHSPKRQEITVHAEVEVVSAEEVERQEEQARAEEIRMKLEEANAGRAKLWFRRWKHKTDAKVEVKRIRLVKAQAAMSSMILGLPLQQWRKRMTTSKFITEGLGTEDLYRLTTHRIFRLNNMWKFLDVSTIVSAVLRSKNPRATTIYWKLVFSVGSNAATGAADLPARWLRSKLLGNSHNNTSETCFISSKVETGVTCHCITKELGQDFSSTINGASAILFLVDKGPPLSKTRRRLHSLVDSLPSDSRLPLLIFTTGYEVDKDDAIRRPPPEEELALLLQLHRLDGNRISSWIVLSATGESVRSSMGFYSSETLAKGLEWLATLAPSQPELYAADLRDVVAEKLANTLALSLKANPRDFVLAFNKALDAAAAEVLHAAIASPKHWPPPELASAPEEWFKDKDKGANVPFAGWNDPASLQPIFDALELCHLPQFPHLNEEAASVLALSPGVSAEIILDCARAQYRCLLLSFKEYLSKLGHGEAEALHRAATILDSTVNLNWSEAGCRILPNWRRVFQSIFWTKLMRLNSEPPPTVYLLRELTGRGGSGGGDEAGSDYEKRLAFASQLRSGADLPDSIKDGVFSFVESFNRQYSREIEEQPELSRGGEVCDVIWHELDCLKSSEENKLLSMLPAAMQEEEPVVPQIEQETRLEELIAKLNAKLDENAQAAATGLDYAWIARF